MKKYLAHLPNHSIFSLQLMQALWDGWFIQALGVPGNHTVCALQPEDAARFPIPSFKSLTLTPKPGEDLHKVSRNDLSMPYTVMLTAVSHSCWMRGGGPSILSPAGTDLASLLSPRACQHIWWQFSGHRWIVFLPPGWQLLSAPWWQGLYCLLCSSGLKDGDETSLPGWDSDLTGKPFFACWTIFEVLCGSPLEKGKVLLPKLFICKTFSHLYIWSREYFKFTHTK